MFYEPLAVQAPSADQETDLVRALIVLTPSESKRLIAKGVAALPEVKRALSRGRIIIARGTTNSFIAEEILGEKVPRLNYAAGIVSSGELRAVPEEDRLEPILIVDGKPSKDTYRDVLHSFDAGDVFVKGANAVDPEGNAGILVANDRGGTIGGAWPVTASRGSLLIIAVGLEKLVPSVTEAALGTGTRRWKYCMGTRVALVPITNAHVVTEIQALEVLTGVTATHLASGGIGGSEGAVVLALDGYEEEVSAAFDLVKSIKGEPPVPGL